MLAPNPHRCPSCGQDMPPIARFGLTMYANAGKLVRNGRKAILTPTQFEVFEHLIDAYPTYCRRSAIFDGLYGERDNQPKSERIIEAYLVKVRRLVGGLGIVVENRRAVGWRLR